MIAAVLKGVAEMIRTDEALCRIDVTKVVPQIEEVLSTIAARYVFFLKIFIQANEYQFIKNWFLIRPVIH